MKHKVCVMVEQEKKGVFGKKKTYVPKTVKVDAKTYRKIKKEQDRRAFEDFIAYDMIFGGDD